MRGTECLVLCALRSKKAEVWQPQRVQIEPVTAISINHLPVCLGRAAGTFWVRQLSSVVSLKLQILRWRASGDKP